MSLQEHWKNDCGLSWYFSTAYLKYSPVGAWLVHSWVSWDMRERLIDLNHLVGLVFKKVEVFRASAKGLKPLFGRKIFASRSSRSSRYLCHSFRARLSTSDRAADRETNRGKRRALFGMVELAADLAFLSVMVM